jgi:uncharacterized protein
MNETIARIVAYARHVTEPEMIILFGSMADGRQTEHSDIDLLVVVDQPCHRQHFAKQITAYAREFGMPADVLIHTKEEVEMALLKPLSFLGSVLVTGKIIFKKVV